MTRGFDRPLYILPFDHRGSFETGMFGWKGRADRRADGSDRRGKTGNLRRFQSCASPPVCRSRRLASW